MPGPKKEKTNLIWSNFYSLGRVNNSIKVLRFLVSRN